MKFINQILKSMSTIKINNMTYSGSNIVISNGKVTINGKDVTPDGKEINISVEGNIEKLEIDACNKVSVTGDCGSVKTLSGNIDIGGSVKGSVQASSGDIECGNVGGSVQTSSGDIDCDDIQGDISTMSGDIKHRKA